jgi:ADP-heptose:LPS heptosyltransferase
LLDGVEWSLMQRGPASADWGHAFGRAPSMSGILDEARELSALDLLISVDTCSAHLAGALGVPVWLLLRKDADWRWMRDRADSPWYPGMRIFRQPQPDDWASVLSEVRRELARVRLRS